MSPWRARLPATRPRLQAVPPSPHEFRRHASSLPHLCLCLSSPISVEFHTAATSFRPGCRQPRIKSVAARKALRHHRTRPVTLATAWFTTTSARPWYSANSAVATAPSPRAIAASYNGSPSRTRSSRRRCTDRPCSAQYRLNLASSSRAAACSHWNSGNLMRAAANSASARSPGLKKAVKYATAWSVHSFVRPRRTAAIPRDRPDARIVGSRSSPHGNGGTTPADASHSWSRVPSDTSALLLNSTVHLLRHLLILFSYAAQQHLSLSVTPNTDT